MQTETARTETTRIDCVGSFTQLRDISRGKQKLVTVDQGIPPNSPDHFITDDEGRDYVTPEGLRQLRREAEIESAVNHHGNDPNRRLDMGRFPTRGRRFMATYDYLSVLKQLGFKKHDRFDWQFIYGGKGTGKTTIACRQAWEWMKQCPSRKAVYLSIAEWLEQVKSSGMSDDPLPRGAGFVILDDIDKFYNTDWQMSQIFRLVDYLYRRDVRVIITANLNLADLVRKSDNDRSIQTVADRIKERTFEAKIGINRQSYR